VGAAVLPYKSSAVAATADALVAIGNDIYSRKPTTNEKSTYASIGEF